MLDQASCAAVAAADWRIRMSKRPTTRAAGARLSTVACRVAGWTKGASHGSSRYLRLMKGNRRLFTPSVPSRSALTAVLTFSIVATLSGQEIAGHLYGRILQTAFKG